MNVVYIEGHKRKSFRKQQNKAHNTERLIEVVKVFPPTGARLVRVHFVWPCFNCRKPLEVGRDTFQQLESRTLLGIKCGTCLEPPKPGLRQMRDWLRSA